MAQKYHIYEPIMLYIRLMMRFNWEQKDWPNFTYTLHGIEDALFAFAERVGQITGMLKALPEDVQMEALIDIMVAEAIKTSAIEGEFLSRQDVLSSIRKNLGLERDSIQIQDKKAEGISKLMIDVRHTFKEKLTNQKLYDWHKMLMGENSGIMVGAWRTHEDPMQVISGAMGKQKIHFEAPPSSIVNKEMDQFIDWFNETAPGAGKEIKKPQLRSAIAHLYFESIHPFEDGNGRIGRAIAEKALSQGIGRPVMLSLSRTIEAAKKEYYAALENAQRTNEITAWVEYFVKTTLDAQVQAEEQIEFTLKKAKFFDRFKGQLSHRQLIVIKRMLEEGYNGFEGGMNAAKYIGLTKTSKATATRDMQDLLERGAFIPYGNAGGRSTSYQVNL